MDLHRLHIFLAIVEEGSLSAAARRIHLTQPALSRNLRLLEEDLGTPLFARQGRRLVLNASGRALIPKAQALMQSVEEARGAVMRAADRSYFDLRLGTVDSVATYLLPRIIVPLRERFPGLAVKLRTGRTHSLLGELEADDLDIVIAAWSGDPPDYGRWHRLGPYAYRYYGRRDLYPELPQASTNAEVQRFPVVEIEAMPGQPTLIPDDAPSYAVAGSLASVKALILGGVGVGGLLGFMLTDEEDAALHTADLPHDPHCALFLVGAPGRHKPVDLQIEETAAAALRAIFT